MGDWNLTVIGCGAHHNKEFADDVDRMFADFVRRLKAAGHDLEHASMTYGGRETRFHKRAEDVPTPPEK